MIVRGDTMYLIIAILIIIYFVVKENMPSKMPPNAYFDWDEYYRDIDNGMDCMTQLRKEQNYGYYKSRDTHPPKK